MNFTDIDITYKDAYEEIIKVYPGISDIAFSTLMIWWNIGFSSQFTEHKGNLILNYRREFALPEDVGVCVIGTSDVDTTVSDIFSWQKTSGMEQKIVHVPEFTVSLLNRQKFQVTEELPYNEYLLSAQQILDLDGPQFKRMRRKIQRFEKEAGTNITVAEIDLSDKKNGSLLLTHTQSWMDVYGSSNDVSRDELRAMSNTLGYANALGVRNLCLYVDGELHGFALFRSLPGTSTTVINHLRVQYVYHHTFDYIVREVARETVKLSDELINLEMDLGIPGLREHKMTLRPIDFHRKYTVTPL